MAFIASRSSSRRQRLDFARIAEGLALALLCGLFCEWFLRWVLLSDPFFHSTRLHDDAYYYLQPAWNVSRTGVFSLDGIEPTYGFQPLWMLLLAGLALLCPDKSMLVPAALLLCGALFVGTGVNLWLFARRLGARGFALLPATVWLMADPGVSAVFFMGMENTLTAFLITLAAAVAIGRREPGVAPDDWPTGRRSLVLGLLGGLICLTRFNSFFAILLGGVLLLGPGGRRRHHRGLRYAAAALGVMLPWLIYARVVFGVWLPTSGALKLNQGPWVSAPLSGLSAHLWEAWSRFAAGRETAVVTLLLLGLVAGLLLAAWRRRDGRPLRPRWPRAFRLLVLLILLAAGLVSPTFNYLFVFNHRNTEWYRVSEHLAMLVLLSAAGYALFRLAIELLARASHQAPIRRTAPLLLGLLLSALLVHGRPPGLSGFLEPKNHSIAQRRCLGYYVPLLRWMDRNLPPGARVGSWNAGFLSFFSEHPVTNLDGLAASPEFVRRLLDRSHAEVVPEYMRERGIRYQADLWLIRELEGGRLNGVWGPGQFRVLHRLNYPIQTRDPETNLNNVAVVEFGRFPAPDPALPIFPFEIDRRIAEVEFAVPAAIYERIDANRTPVAELRQVATADLESLGGGRYRVPADAHAQVDFAVPDLAAPVPRPYLVLQLQATSHPPPNDVTVYFGSPDFDWARSYSFPTPGDGLSRRYYLPLHAGSERVSLDRLRWVRIAPMDPPANAPGEVEIQGLWLHSGAGFLVEPGVAEDLPR